MAKQLPPLNALRAFESAGRHLSFTKAAQELNVTPAAVSHQIKALEESVGVMLFKRHPGAISLTDAGIQALPAVSEGFEKLALGVDHMLASVSRESLAISVTPSFGALWLLPRLEQFRAAHPEIELQIDATDHLADLARDDVDVAIRYGPGDYTGVRVDLLFKQVNIPVCSPALLSGNPSLKTPDDLRHHTLLHVDWKSEEARWQHWLSRFASTDVADQSGPRFTMENMAVQAAIDGQGVALVGDVLVADEIRAGRLVHPFDSSLVTPLEYSYYLLCLEPSRNKSSVETFRQWLLAQVNRLERSAENPTINTLDAEPRE